MANLYKSYKGSPGPWSQQVNGQSIFKGWLVLAAQYPQGLSNGAPAPCAPAYPRVFPAHMAQGERAQALEETGEKVEAVHHTPAGQRPVRTTSSPNNSLKKISSVATAVLLRKLKTGTPEGQNVKR